MQVRKIAGQFDFDFTHDGRRVRRVMNCDDLVHFLEGGDFAALEANLPPGKVPASFYDFVYEFYLPLHSKAAKKPLVHKTDCVTIRALARHFGDMLLHRIQASDWEEYKKLRLAGEVPVRCQRIAAELQARVDRRLAPDRPASTWTINRELSGLNQVLEYALSLKLIKENHIERSRRLPTKARKEYWLRKNEIDLFLAAVPARQARHCDRSPLMVRDLAEFLILTGARIGEAFLFHEPQVDWKRREIQLITFKKRGKERAKVYRYLSIDSLGPRLEALLRRLKAHPETGYYFVGPRGEPLRYPWVRTRLVKGARAAGFDWLRPHDLRHTFAMHRAIMVKDFRQLQMELGHEDPSSVQAYLDNTSRMTREDSIF